MAYNNLKVFRLESPTLVPLDQIIEFNIAMNSSPCHCSGLDLSTECSSLGVHLLQMEPFLCAIVFSGVYPQQQKLIHSRSHFEMHLFSIAFFMGPNALRAMMAPAWPYPWLHSLHGCTCSIKGLSMATCFEVLQHDLMHSH